MLAAIAVVLAAACSSSSSAPAAATTPVPATAAIAFETPAPLSPPVATATPDAAVPSRPLPEIDVVRQAYDEITGQLFKQVAPRDLLTAAWNAVGIEARRERSDAPDPTPFQARGSEDIDGFTRELTALLRGPGDALDATRIGQAAVRGMALAVGDSHTRFLTPDQADSQRREVEGLPSTYVGIGIRIDRLDAGITIAQVYPASPAERAGLQPGDVIVGVNGQEVGALSPDDVTRQIRGPEGGEVRISVQRGLEAVRDVTLSRAKVVVPVEPAVTSSMLEEGIGYIRIRSFPRRSMSLDAAAVFDSQLAALISQGARGIVLDLRGNPGGDPYTSVSVASAFVPSGPILVAVDRDGKRMVYNAIHQPVVFQGPVAVLIDRGTASGAEVVASALEEYDAGYLVGSRSCGCLSVGRPVQLGDNSGLVITVQQALTGKEARSLEGVGVLPDELVRPASTGDPQRDHAAAYVRAHLP
jgi:carboxyl-terminal processing protease